MAIRYTIEDMQEYAAFKGGRCLSREYVNSITKLEWQCEFGHRWETMFYVIKQGGWCPQCTAVEARRLRLEDVKQLAISRGGKCLSDHYENNRTRLQFQCAEGHVWETDAHNIKGGSWCWYCAGVARYTIEKFQSLAEQKGGQCLSEKYVNVFTPLQWKCAKGHVWVTKPTMIRQGYWCPFCAGRPIRTIKDMQALAKKRGGKCLSEEYVNNHTKLEWQCEKGHVWETKPNNVRNGHWCPVCSKKQMSRKKKNGRKKKQRVE